MPLEKIVSRAQPYYDRHADPASDDSQAQKMLASALKLAQQLGAPDQRACIVTAPEESGSDKAPSPPVLVGDARLALWSGERLLGTSPAPSALSILFSSASF